MDQQQSAYERDRRRLPVPSGFFVGVLHALLLSLAAGMLLSLLGGCAVRPLSAKEWKMEAAVLTAGLIDYAQTRDIKNHPELYETNPLLGENPSDTRIRNYFIAAGLAHVGIAHLLPRPYRMPWQMGWLTLQVINMQNNHRLGLRLEF
jgi:hypothetical protein